MSRTSDIGLSRKQKMFVTLESVLGTLTFPNATTDFVRPAGNAIMNQRPVFADSEELADTLDILDQFQNATPAGDFTIKMYVRPSGTAATGSPPQGDVLFRSLQGSKAAATAATLSAATLSTTATSVVLVGANIDDFPHVGVILVGSEKIGYLAKSTTGATATLSNLTRAYNGTSAASHATSSAVSLDCIFYKQMTTSESFSVWIETDHFVQAMAGCSVNTATVEITNEGGLLFTFVGQGMTMKWAGTGTVAAHAATAATTVTVSDARLFCPQMKVYNVTKASTPTVIIGSNATTNVLRLTDAVGASWVTGDVIKGYLPTGTVIGDPIEAKDSVAYLNNVQTKIKRCTLNIGTPKQYLTDEIGTTFPEDYLENVRDINTTLSLYFRKQQAKYFKDGYDGNEIPITVVFGDTGGAKMGLYMKRCKAQVPEINFTPPAVNLDIPAKALGTVGEDSLEIVMM